MKAASQGTLDALSGNTAVTDSVRVIAEWNHNRYAGIESIDNVPSDQEEGYDNDNFPIESIVEPNRPRQGIVKGLAVGGATIKTGGGYSAKTTSSNVELNTMPHFLTVSPNAKYKYWIHFDTATIPENNSFSFASPAQPTIIYKESFWINKVTAQFETTITTPTNFRIDVTTDQGDSWTTIAINPEIVDGRVDIWRNEIGWGALPDYDHHMLINGVRVVVNSIDQQDGRLMLIELAPKLELDISNYVSQYSTNFSLSDSVRYLPIGPITSNSGSLTLFDYENVFLNENTSSILHNRIRRNVEIKIDHAINGEWFRMATMSVDAWNRNSNSITVRLIDNGELFQTIKPNPILLQNMTVGEIAWRLLDMNGYNNYQYVSAQEASTRVDAFWINGETTLWNALGDLAQVTQTAMFFDEYGKFNIMNRDAAISAADNPVYSFTTNDSNGVNANVVSYSEDEQEPTNEVKIKWTKIANYEEDKSRQVIWEPEGSLVIRSSNLVRELGEGITSLKINPAEAKHWPYKGMVQINNEVIRYDGKWYTYYNKSGQRVSQLVKSSDEKKQIDEEKSKEELVFKNAFSGYLRIAERAVWNTTESIHKTDISDWDTYRVNGNDVFTRDHLSKFDRTNGQMDLRVAHGKSNTWVLAQQNWFAGNDIGWFGTRLRFKKNSNGFAGIACNLNSRRAGYYVEIATTKKARRNKATKEINVYIKKNNGKIKRVNKGVSMPIGDNKWYKIDVKVDYRSNTDKLTVFVDGVNKGSWIIPTANLKRNLGKVAMFARSKGTKAEFEYAYAIKRGVKEFETLEESTFFDWVEGGYTSNTLYSDHIWNDLTKKYNKSVKNKFNNMRLDDFGSVAHEIREMDVKFEDAPVLNSRIYNSNQRSFVAEYIPNSFGAKFVLVNASRRNEVLSGEDSSTYDGNEVNQVFMIYGQSLQMDEDAEDVDVRDEDSIREHGVQSIDIDSQWIQSESSAQKIGEWITERWASSPKQVQLEVFGNPLIQTSDVVELTHDDMFLDQQRFVVASVNNTFSQGLVTTLTLTST